MSHLTELIVQILCMVCYSIKSVISKLRNIFKITTAIQTHESNMNLSDKSMPAIMERKVARVQWFDKTLALLQRSLVDTNSDLVISDRGPSRNLLEA